VPRPEVNAQALSGGAAVHAPDFGDLGAPKDDATGDASLSTSFARDASIEAEPGSPFSRRHRHSRS
jgi:hypothetical protein